jgi:hypothetical protein
VVIFAPPSPSPDLPIEAVYRVPQRTWHGGTAH